MKAGPAGFYKVIYNDFPEDSISVEQYVLGDFDHTVFWQSKAFPEALPESVRNYVNSGKAKPVDYLANPLSWPICSDRLMELIWPLVSNDVQVFEAPLFEMGFESRVFGYKLLNILSSVPCLDLEKSVVGRSDEDGTLMGVYEMVITSAKVPTTVHLFRPVEWKHAIIVSEELVTAISGKGLKGLALERCKID
ncbi:MAG TPA: DUF1629 domain-containing protein [Verrucomicrobiae bacterium]|nr:DUF1629 domain-containing protein [Verrucomicrobiae bacterium]